MRPMEQLASVTVDTPSRRLQQLETGKQDKQQRSLGQRRVVRPLGRTCAPIMPVEQQQQQQHQQVSPLGQAGSAANAAAAGPATHRPSGLLGSQAFLRNSSSKGKSSSASQRKAGTRQQQRQKSLAAELQGLRYDPSLLFVPARPLASDSGGVVSDLQAGGPHAAGSYAEQDGSVHGFSSVSRSPGPGLQGGRQQGAGASLGLSSSHCIASKPFKAPWLSQPGSADGEAAAVTAVGGSAGCFGAFGSFACGAQPAGGSTSRRLGGRLL